MKNNINYVDWDDKYLIGINSIDAQHKHFVGILNRLFLVIQSESNDSVTNIINELVDYADRHFATEERYFKKHNYPYSLEHTNEHNKIKRKIIKLLNSKTSDQFKLGYSLLDLLEEWLFKHIIAVDVKYVDFLKQKGIK
jgi:hemerythrin